MELKNILARQPGPEVAEQLSIYQQNLREKTRQMKVKGGEAGRWRSGGGRCFLWGGVMVWRRVADQETGDGVGAQHVSSSSERVQIRDREAHARAARREEKILRAEEKRAGEKSFYHLLLPLLLPSSSSSPSSVLLDVLRLLNAVQLAKSTGERDSKGFPVHQAPGGQRFTGGGFSLSTG